ncbi:hypothetical protein HAX54_036629, partial [Datura stramonium]|nr:hypothetical protein [Datura stramonium]
EQNHTIDNCYRLIGFPSDFKFTKTKKFGLETKSNASYPTEKEEDNVGEKPMTQEQFHSLYQYLKHVNIGTYSNGTCSIPDTLVSAPPSPLPPIPSSSPCSIHSASSSQHPMESRSPTSSSPQSAPPPIRQSARLHKSPAYLEDYICNSIIHTNLTQSCLTST